MQQSVKKIKDVDITKLDVNRIIYLLQEIIATLNQENQILEKMDINQFEHVYIKKVSLIEELEVHQLLIKKKPELVKILGNQTKSLLQQLSAEFEEVKNKNIKILELAILVNRKLVDVIKNAVKEKLERDSGYANDGYYAAKDKLSKSIPSISYNNQI